MANNTSWSGQRHSFPARTRRAILRRDPTCQLGYTGCTIDSTEADHIIGHADATAAGWDPADIDDENNGQGVCQPCHLQKTARERARGQQRSQSDPRRQRARPTERHPGLIDPS